MSECGVIKVIEMMCNKPEGRIWVNWIERIDSSFLKQNGLQNLSILISIRERVFIPKNLKLLQRKYPLLSSKSQLCCILGKKIGQAGILFCRCFIKLLKQKNFQSIYERI